MFIVNHRKAFFALTGLIVLASLISLGAFGLRFGIDFTGGTLAQISYDGPRPAANAVVQQLNDAGFKDFSLREYGTDGYTLRAQTLTNEERGNLASYFSNQQSAAHVAELNEIGPTIGTELRNKAFIALGLVLLCILLFIAFAFRNILEAKLVLTDKLIQEDLKARDMRQPT